MSRVVRITRAPYQRYVMNSQAKQSAIGSSLGGVLEVTFEKTRIEFETVEHTPPHTHCDISMPKKKTTIRRQPTSTNALNNVEPFIPGTPGAMMMMSPAMVPTMPSSPSMAPATMDQQLISPRGTSGYYQVVPRPLLVHTCPPSACSDARCLPPRSSFYHRNAAG